MPTKDANLSSSRRNDGLEAYNSTNILSPRLVAGPAEDPGGVFTTGGPIFLGFAPNSPNINAIKTAFLEAFLLAKGALPHVQAKSPTYLRYFKRSRVCRVTKIFSYILGPNGKGPDAMRAADWPLRVVYQDATLIGVPPSLNPCATDPFVYAAFYNDPYDARGPALLACNSLFFGPDIEKLRISDWDKMDCKDIPDWMEMRLKTIAFVILHELCHWAAQTKKATGDEQFPVEIGDYGNNAGVWTKPQGEPKNGYGPYHCWTMNERPDLDTTKNADSYAWMAMEAFVATKCPDKTMNNPPPEAPRMDRAPPDFLAPRP